MKLTLAIFFLVLNPGLARAQNLTVPSLVNISDTTGFFIDFMPLLNNVVSTYVNSVAQLDFCTNQMVLFMSALNKSEEWAWQMIDATAKPQAGILYGNIMHVGNYEECLSINIVVSNEQVEGKYCTVPFQPHPKYGTNMVLYNAQIEAEEENFAIANRISYGICVPKACNEQHIQDFFDFFEEIFQFPFHFRPDENLCNTSEVATLSTAAIIALCIFSFFALVTLLHTVYDICDFQFRADQKPSAYIAFSLLTNSKKLFSVNRGDDNFGCLNGLRVISLMWVMLGHGFTYYMYSPNINTITINDWIRKTDKAVIAAGEMAVDTFFFIGGLLLVFIYMKNEKAKKNVSIPLYYLHRILRLTPSLAMVILFSATLLKYIGDGPFWIATEVDLQTPCEKNWWQTLLYIQNYVNPEKMCVGHAWYLAVDTQMYFISPLIMYILIRWPKKAIALLILYLFLIFGYVFDVSRRKHLGCTFFDLNPEHMKTIYVPTHVRGCAYLQGMICGYVLFKTNTKKIKIHRALVGFLWIAALSLMLLIVFSHNYFLKREYAEWEPALFNAGARILWCIAVFAVIFLCVHGYGSYVNSFLSHSIFTVLIRLNYNLYLLHVIVQQTFSSQRRTPDHLSSLFGYHQFWGNYMFTLALAIIWTLMFESPVLILEKVLLTPRKKVILKQNHQNENGNNSMV